MYVVFIHGAPAAGKHTIGVKLFAFGTPAFNRMRATIWRAAFSEAAATGRSFIFTFNPEATVDPALIEELRRTVQDKGGRVHFVQLECSDATVEQRIGNESRTKFGKLTDPELYKELRVNGAFAFPSLPKALLVVNTEALSAESAAQHIAQAVAAAADDA